MRTTSESTSKTLVDLDLGIVILKKRAEDLDNKIKKIEQEL